MSSIDGLISSIRIAPHTFLCGNGGSAANAIHIANDLVLCGYRGHALCADIATFSALANDFGYEEVFSRQVSVFGSPGDLLIVLSGSGNSPNVLKALEMAKQRNMMTWAIVGAYGETQAEKIASHTLKFGWDMQAAEEAQVRIGHDLMRNLKG